MSKSIPEELLNEVRFQAETIFRLALYKRPEFNFLPAIGVKDIFESMTDPEYGYIGSLHLKYHNDNKTGPYWKSTWYDKAIDVINIAEKLQEEKAINEDTVVNYHMHYIDMIYGRKNTGIILLS